MCFFFWFLVMKFVYLTSDLEITKREIIIEKSLRQSLSSLWQLLGLFQNVA